MPKLTITPRPIRPTRGAGLLEYVALAGLVSVAAVSAVLSLGDAATTGPTAAVVALDDAGLTPSDAMPTPPASGPVAPPAGGSVAGDGASAPVPPPAPVVPSRPAGCYVGVQTVFPWSWYSEYTAPTSTPTDFAPYNPPPALHLVNDCFHFPAASYVSFGNTNPIFGAGPFDVDPPASFSQLSGYRLAGAGHSVEVEFADPVSGLEFHLKDLDGLLSVPAQYSNGRLVRPAVVGYRDSVRIEGVAPDGSTVYPVASSPASATGGGTYLGFANRNCSYNATDCTAAFAFTDTVVALRITSTGGGTVDVSDLHGFVAVP
jgi:Flp pilus assembly pilin Flp